MRRLVSLLALVALATGCATTQTYVAPERRDEPVPALPGGEVAHQVFLTANTGDLDGDAGRALRALADAARAAGEDATVVVLGDVTDGGLPDDDAPGRARAEAPVRALIAALDGVSGDVVVVPGDRDWGRGEDGVKRLEDLLDDAFGDDVLTPGDQAGGPREWEPAEGLRLIALDTAWWLLDDDDRPEGEAEDQDIRLPSDVARVLEQVILDRDDSRIVVLAHHPLISRGPRGGHRSNALSSLASRTLGLGTQDLASPRYRSLRSSLGRVAATHDRLVWAAGHDRILQTYDDVINTLRRQTHLVAGTGGDEASAASGGDGALYVSSRPGYQRLVYYADGRLWGETVEVDEGGAARVVFRVELAGVNAELVDTEVPVAVAAAELPPEIGRTVTRAADQDFVTDRFKNDGFTRAVFGKNYRDVWKTPVAFRTIDLGTEAGGLEPVKRGGGLQTITLRLKGGDGHEYGLRLLEKSGLAQVPYALRDGLVGDIVLELRAAMIPYGSLVTAPLARTAGVPQPDPEIVFVPDDPRLGRYRETFANRLALFEVRPNDDMSDVAGFEGMTDVVSAASMREEVREDQDHRVDQRAYLRARLFDMLVADWDRHADQWRWAAYEPGELDPSLTGDAATQGKVYRPIARDRDFAFFRTGGLLGFFLAYGDDRFEPYGPDYTPAYGLTFNGFDQDRRFFNQLTREDMLEVARDLQRDLTDLEIGRAVASVPREVRRIEGTFWERALQGRRDQLPEYAERLYRLHANVVDVIGSDQRELFEAEHQPNGDLLVTVSRYKGGNKGRQLYQRTFDADATNEVRLYGFAGRDRFAVRRDGPIRVRIIGGGGEDEATSDAGNVFAYDTPDGIELDGRLRDRRSSDPSVNRYDPKEYVPTNRRLVPFGGYNATDGVSLGLGAQIMVPGFRLGPDAGMHFVFGDVLTSTGGVALGYQGRMREAVRTLDLEVDAIASTPRYVRNFYGFGNETLLIDPDDARIQLARVQGDALLGGQLGERFRFVAGPSLRYADARRDTTGFVPEAIAGLPADAFSAQFHAGGAARLSIGTVLPGINPRQGVRILGHAAGYAPVTGAADAYGRVGGEVIAYVPFSLRPQLTLALRAGADHRLGDFPFFDGAVVGATTGLRGYRRERFTGTTAAFANAEIRTKLFEIPTLLAPVDVGAFGFADAGRVFPDASSNGLTSDLQIGAGGGLWFGLLDYGLLTTTLARGEETLFSVGLGFQY